jgi:hypothetical protein
VRLLDRLALLVELRVAVLVLRRVRHLGLLAHVLLEPLRVCGLLGHDVVAELVLGQRALREVERALRREQLAHSSTGA